MCELGFSNKIKRDEWYHLCFAWKSGEANFYIDGIEIALTIVKGQLTGEIAQGGTLVLGQEQDEPGGRFSDDDIFGGNMFC